MKVSREEVYVVELPPAEAQQLMIALSRVVHALEKLPPEDYGLLVVRGSVEPLVTLHRALRSEFER